MLTHMYIFVFISNIQLFAHISNFCTHSNFCDPFKFLCQFKFFVTHSIFCSNSNFYAHSNLSNNTNTNIDTNTITQKHKKIKKTQKQNSIKKKHCRSWDSKRRHYHISDIFWPNCIHVKDNSNHKYMEKVVFKCSYVDSKSMGRSSCMECWLLFSLAVTL